MHPELFSIGGLTINSYGLFLGLGIFSGYLLTLNLAKYRNIKKDFIEKNFFGIIISGILGARIAYILISSERYLNNPIEILKFWQGGLVFWGGIIGGTLWVVYSCKKKALKVLVVGDIIVAGLMLGLAIGRIGCFFAGCCYGLPTNVFWGITFTNPLSLAPLGIALHPTQIYSSIFSFILAAVLYFMIKFRKSKNGFVFGFGILIYSLFRITIEFFRGDFRGELIGFLTPTQWIAVSGVILGFVILRKK